LAIGVLGLLSVPLLYRRPAREDVLQRPAKSVVFMLVGGSIGVAGLVVLTILFGRAEAFSRIMAPDPLADARFGFWGTVFDLAWKYFPFGSGVGTFVETYQIDEPHQLLGPTYLNHAHNDWLEVWVTGGIAGLLLLGTATIAWLRASLNVWRASVKKERGPNFGRLGSILLLMLALASFGDYPLRVPSIACLAVCFALWLGGTEAHEAAPRSAKSVGNSDRLL
jgi:O-antigen ligase